MLVAMTWVGITVQSSNGFEASNEWPVVRQACSSRAAVFIVSPTRAISRLNPPTQLRNACRMREKLGGKLKRVRERKITLRRSPFL